ncbi:hypothetical protein FRB95_013311 [Tulasnella sp. JGI-2019a]|nr:hypothetical protein FRB93_000996 [Tulasnella sp. JGI-2019a]KAG9034403.1 hypothetical protein FRB95_013311 [Tulasnella sp. JGI-2019a]
MSVSDQGPYYALGLPEIRLQIFEELATDDLLNAALVCKTWSWLAVDTAWRSSTFRLSWVLAPLTNYTARQLQNCKIPEYLLDLSGSEDRVVSTERRDFQLTSRITRLIIDLPWKVTLAIDMAQLKNPLGGPIFPNLLSLEHDIDGPELADEEIDMERWTPLLPLLVGPRIEKLTLAFYAVTKQVVDDNIQSLIRIAPGIRTVIIENCTDGLPLDYSPFSQMKSLTVRGCMDHQTWRCLASCPRLESIVLWEDDNGPEIVIEAQHYSVTFPYVKTLSIDHSEAHRDAEFILALLRGAAMPALQSLEIKFPQPGEAAREITGSEILVLMGRSQLLKEVVINGCVTQAG